MRDTHRLRFDEAVVRRERDAITLVEQDSEQPPEMALLRPGSQTCVEHAFPEPLSVELVVDIFDDDAEHPTPQLTGERRIRAKAALTQIAQVKVHIPDLVVRKLRRFRPPCPPKHCLFRGGPDRVPEETRRPSGEDRLAGDRGDRR